MRNIGLLLIAFSFWINGYTQPSDTIKDIRDGNIYKIVKIGNQWWMAENLRFESKSGCWWYENVPKDKGLPYYYSVEITKELFGDYYTVEAAKKLFGGYYAFEIAKKVCPVGWHLPSDKEWLTLANSLGDVYLAGGKLKSKEIWEPPNKGATNESGFSAVAAGFRDLDSCIVEIGRGAYFWSSNEYEWGNCSNWDLAWDGPGFRNNEYGYKKNTGLNVRCIKDIPKTK